MRLSSESFSHNGRIPANCAFGIPHAKEHMTLGKNLNPQFSWSNIPDRAGSLILMCVDPDVPSSADDVNQEGKRIPATLPRVDFYHWVMIDLSAAAGAVAEGECSQNVTVGGKRKPPGPAGSRQGLNDYTGFLAGNPDMQGDYFGYDGPCPPWNDEILHHYHFQLFAIDLERCPVADRFTGGDVMAAIAGHIVAQTELIGTYSLSGL